MKRLITLFLFLNISLINFSQSLVSGIEITPDNRFLGRGNKSEIMLKVKITLSDEIDSIYINSLTISTEGTTSINDISKLSIYHTDSINFFDPKTENNLFATNSEIELNTTCLINKEINHKINYLWVTYDISENAGEGNFVNASIVSITINSEIIIIENQDITAHKEIILCRKLLYAPGDYESKNYRIPAIITAKDGSLVIATDKRKNNQNDLPQDIDILINRSIDNGKTWSGPYSLARGSGYGSGFGDAAISLTNEDNGLICVFVGGCGLWESTALSPIKSYMCKSNDNGITWSEPIEITDFIYGSGCSDNTRKHWRASFFGSGRGLLCKNGRIMFVAAIRQSSAYTLSNYVIYSDDNGSTWHVSEKASSGGDEAKVVELNDGRVLMSIRKDGKRMYNISNDGGISWQSEPSTWNDLQGPACNGDMIRYTSTNNGYNKNRILHSLPDSTIRTNLAIYTSYDEGVSWPSKKRICNYGSAYSSLTILCDGTIGAYIEENYDSDNYSMYFMNFSLDWLSSKKDIFEPAEIKKETDNEK